MVHNKSLKEKTPKKRTKLNDVLEKENIRTIFLKQIHKFLKK